MRGCGRGSCAGACGNDDKSKIDAPTTSGSDSAGGGDAPDVDSPTMMGDASIGAACGSMTCGSGTECCTGGGSGSTCVASGPCTTVAFACDGPEDCPGQVCWYGAGGGSAGTISALRTASSLVVALVAGCGDNAGDCGYTHLLTQLRNIWAGQLAVGESSIYYSDYDVDGEGTHIVFRQPRDGSPEIAIGYRPFDHAFGFGMALDDAYVYWAAQADPAGYALFATPLEGGRALQLATMPACDPHGIASDGLYRYAGWARCSDGGADVPAAVIAIAGDGTSTKIWESTTADVEELAARAGTLYIATTAGLYQLTGADAILLDGSPTHRLVLTADELVYSTDEAILARPLSGGSARRVYTFVTDIGQQRAFAVDDTGLYVSEPPQILYVANEREPITLVANPGTGIAHLIARDHGVYWSANAMFGSPGTPYSFSGGVMRATAPCAQ